MIIAVSQYVKNKRRRPFSVVRMFYLENVNGGVEDEDAVVCTMKNFPALTEEQPYYNVDCAAFLSEVSKYISETTTHFNPTPLLTAVV